VANFGHNFYILGEIFPRGFGGCPPRKNNSQLNTKHWMAKLAAAASQWMLYISSY